MKFPRQTAKHLLCLIFLSLAWSDTGASLLCRLASLQEMTHGHLSFIVCGLVAGLVVTAMKISCTCFLVSSVFLENLHCPAHRQSGCRAWQCFICVYFSITPSLMWFFFIQSVRISFNACRIYDFLKKQIIPASPSEGEVIFDISLCLQTAKHCSPG